MKKRNFPPHPHSSQFNSFPKVLKKNLYSLLYISLFCPPPHLFFLPFLLEKKPSRKTFKCDHWPGSKAVITVGEVGNLFCVFCYGTKNTGHIDDQRRISGQILNSQINHQYCVFQFIPYNKHWQHSNFWFFDFVLPTEIDTEIDIMVDGKKIKLFVFLFIITVKSFRIIITIYFQSRGNITFVFQCLHFQLKDLEKSLKSKCFPRTYKKKSYFMNFKHKN